MAQQFQVLRCCFCHIFQVQQVKKTKKWNCKICNEKQSVLKVFGQGSGSECRHHVQKLNMLVGEKEQASINMPWYAEEPEERDNKLEENLDWQEEKVSRWNKYLDKSCDEEDKMSHTEKQTCSFLNSTTEDPRKYKKTNLDSIDAQRADENRVPGFGKNYTRSSFRDAQTCGNAADKSMRISADDELLECGKNGERKLRNVLSNQMKLLSSETFNRSVAAAAVVECQMPEVQRSAAASNEIIANLIDSPVKWQHIPRQTASIALDKMQTDSKHIEEANILPIKTKNSSVLPCVNLQKVLSKEPTSVPSVHPAFSTATGQNSGLFSTGEDFDDYL
ncbi:MRN complex-interacting protein [Heteronotia binoei]|uniref:MRN complex-interacting protein n=1 Tax=Heteronotia binoei TaxID=13085 RepID=UPI00292E94CD|nr:MRN complex-interacting protein [Heteronotia binoei]